MSWNSLLLVFRWLCCSTQPYGLLTYHFEKYCYPMYLASVHMKQQSCVSSICFCTFQMVDNNEIEKKCASLSLVHPLKKTGNWIQYSFCCCCYWNQLWRWSTEKWYHSTEQWLKMYVRSFFFGTHVPSFSLVLLLFRVVVLFVVYDVYVVVFVVHGIDAWCEWRHKNT